MTGEVIIENFHSIPVRIITREIGRLIPLNDIADGINYDRSGLHKVIKRNQLQFQDFTCMVVTSMQGDQRREQLCLTRDGIIGLLMRLDIEKIKDTAKKERVLEFQTWAMKTLGRVMDGKPVNPPGNVPALVEDHLKIAKLMSENIGISLHIASTVALSAVEDQTGANLSWCKGLLRAGDHPTEYLNPTEIGKDLGITAIRVNSILQELGYQIKQGKEWTLTTSGKLYGEVFPFDIRHKNGSLHTGYQIKWLPDVVQFIRGRLAHDIQASIAGAGR